MRRFRMLICAVLAGLIVLLAAVPGARIKQSGAPDQVQAASESAGPEQSTEPAPTAETTAAAGPEQEGYLQVPRYFQTDYPYIKFGNGTIATSGCSITCLAMVATYLTDHEYTPDQMAYHFGSYGKTNIERLEHGNEEMRLPCEKNEDVQDVLRALNEGKVAIAMMDSESIFTTTQHFIVLAGMTEEGKILVNDPFEPNYTASVYMENAYANGFPDYDIMRGFSGAWIYDKSAMPEEPFLYDAEKPEQQENRYTGYDLTEEDIYTLACLAWAAAREEPEEAQQAVLEVVMNRVVSGDFPNTVRDVINKGELYSLTAQMARAEPDFPQYIAVTSAMYGPYVLPDNVYYFSQWDTSGEVWGQLGSYTFLYSK